MAIATDIDITTQDEAAETFEQPAVERETDEALVEEVSIDGMCGVY